MDKKRRCTFCQSLILKINIFLVLLLLQSGPVGSNFIIDTTAATIQEIDQAPKSTGIIKNKTFHGPNNGTWNYSVASFNLNYSVAFNVFSSGKTVSVRGAHALSVTVQGNFTIGTELDVSGQEVNFTSHEKRLFWLGGFVRVNKSCCALGAGPGGAFSYHGGGHGGRGGGFYQDRNTSRFFGWSYYDTSYLLGGSTGTVLFSSKSGSGGGAIELIAENGTLTVDAPIKADGFSSSNTIEDEHCAGGSSGGLVRLLANKVIIGRNGSLSAAGGNSGYSLNHSHYCGGGGGGGVIQVFSLTDNTNYVANSTIRTRPGHGIQDGEEGLEQVAVYFDRDMDLMINTSSCKMTWASDYEYPGNVEDRIFNVTTEEGQEIKEHLEVCKIEFTSSIFIGPKVRVKFSGHRALSLISTHGNIEINSPLNISELELSSVNSNLGGFVKTLSDGQDAGPANVSNCSSPDLYGYDFEALFGGSVCAFSNVNDPIRAVGGGALELKAEKGAIVIASTISADGYSSNTVEAGAMGGTIRLDANKVILQRKGLLTARGWQAGGGVIQIKSDEDTEGICKSKFDVTGSTLGLVNILVSTAKTFQVQYIQQGILEIDTTNARWIHKLSSNGSMVYSYYGEIETRQLKALSIQYKVAKFEFQTPILINGSAEVKLSGLHSLVVSSEEGIYIGVDIAVGKPKVNEDKAVGGYCVRNSRAPEGLGPGRGRAGTNAGAGHGGKGGLLFEDEGTIYGRTYGIHPDIQVIGGSTGTANCSSNYCTAKNSPELVVACGGGAIKIHSEKNLTINAAIRVSGTTFSIFNQTSSGGSSGGTIILSSRKHVILGGNANLQAQGADAVQNVSDSSSRGGGGGGVIAIFYKAGLVGKTPTPYVNTKGGVGTPPGDNGLVVLNGTRKYGFPLSVIEEGEISLGCVIINSSLLSNFYGVDLKAHEAVPSKCVKKCSAKYQYALIRSKTCKCTNDNSTIQEVNETRCSERCWSNSSLICGGEEAFSVYRTGYIFSFSSSVMSSATPGVSAVFPSKTSVVVMASTSVSLPTEPTNESTNEPTTELTTEQTTESTTPSEEPTTRSPTEPSEKFKEIANATITEENVVEVVQQLKNLTSTETLNGGDMKVALEILYKITFNDSLLPKNKSERQTLGQNILEVASSLLSNENIDNWGVPTEKDNSTGRVTSQIQVLELVENIGLKLGEQLDNNASLVIESKNIAMGVETRVPDEIALGAEFPNYDELNPEWKGQDRVFVHKELFDEMARDKSSRTTVVYALYNQISELFPANTNDRESSKDMIVNSRILALKFNKKTSLPFKKPIKLWFDKLKTENVTKPTCSFVDFKIDGGTWSDAGCHMVDVKDPTVECACDHLTNFAILMQVKEFEIPVEHTRALTIITYVGCGISLFGLALTLATFLSLETLASERTSIHKNLVVAIGLAQIVFLAGIDAVYNPIACKAVALFLHYLYTASFTWMLCEGIHLYSKVVEVFSEGSKMKYYYALGWGLPLTIVFISACSRWDGYGNERACWISIQDGLIWAFVAPVLIIMVINFVVMIMVIKVIIASVTSLQNPGNTSQVRAGVKGMIVLLPLLGLTWVFGIMAINMDTIAFQYLFAILNSLQGLFIFAFHCIGNTEVRVAYKRLHEKRTLAKSLPEHSLSTSHHSSREKRRMDSHETHFTGDEDIIVTKTIRSVSDVKLSGDNMAMQTFGDTDSGRWSLNCPSPDPFDLDHAKRA